MIQPFSNGVFRHITVLGLFVFFSGGMLPGQDLHFTLFNSCPLYLNPANTGNFNGDWRVTGNYRNQWNALSIPFSTAAAGFDKKFYVLNQNLGFGLAFINDQSGSLSLSVNKLMGSLGFEKIIRHHVFHVGLQVGYVLKSLNYANLTLPSQWNQSTGSFDSQLSGNELNMGEKVSNLDLNVGLIWKRKIKRFEPEAGVAFSHLNNPNESFFDDTQRLPVRSTLHAGLRTRISDAFYARPMILYMHHKGASETILGLGAGFNVFGRQSNVKEINAGLYLRNGFLSQSDAVAVSAGATIGRFDIALCYDFTISGLNAASNSLGAFEISLQYKSISTVLNSYSIPCERF